MNHRARKRSAGFTLVELAITVLVMAILASVALPAFARSQVQIQLETAADQLAGAMQYAQSMAVSQCKPFGVSLSVKKNEFYVADMASSSQPIQDPLVVFS